MAKNILVNLAPSEHVADGGGGGWSARSKKKKNATTKSVALLDSQTLLVSRRPLLRPPRLHLLGDSATDRLLVLWQSIHRVTCSPSLFMGVSWASLPRTQRECPLTTSCFTWTGRGFKGGGRKLSLPPLVPPLNFFTFSSSSEGREGELFEFYLPPN